jgi:threonine/homoserine/homoserine lactone efflux protein
MQAIFYFILASAISFVGSLQPGAVNMSVMATASNKQYRQAVYLALGGVIPEALYSIVALFASSIIMSSKEELLVLSHIAAVLLLVIGLWLFFKPSNAGRHAQSVSENPLRTGVVLSLLNPQLILYWITIITWMNLHGFMISESPSIVRAGFIIGTSAGAFALHFSLIAICRYWHEAQWIRLFGLHGNRILGVILVALGLFDLVPFVFTWYVMVG